MTLNRAGQDIGGAKLDKVNEAASTVAVSAGSVRSTDERQMTPWQPSSCLAE